METQEIIKIIISLTCFVWINWDFIVHRKEFWKAIKGLDKTLQTTEACIYVWVRIFPIIVLADLFYNFHVNPEVWYSLDAIFFGLIAGDMYMKYKDKIKTEEPPKE